MVSDTIDGGYNLYMVVRRLAMLGQVRRDPAEVENTDKAYDGARIYEDRYLAYIFAS